MWRKGQGLKQHLDRCIRAPLLLLWALSPPVLLLLLL
jgi:hypothetical protein